MKTYSMNGRCNLYGCTMRYGHKANFHAIRGHLGTEVIGKLKRARTGIPRGVVHYFNCMDAINQVN